MTRQGLAEGGEELRLTFPGQANETESVIETRCLRCSSPWPISRNLHTSSMAWGVQSPASEGTRMVPGSARAPSDEAPSENS